MPTSKDLIKRDATYISLNMNKTALIKAMRIHGLTATKVIKPIVEALEATKVISAVNSGDANGATTDFIDVPDHSTRLRAAQVAIELLGLKKGEQLPSVPNDNKALRKALQNADEVKLTELFFTKNGEQPPLNIPRETVNTQQTEKQVSKGNTGK